MSKKQIKKAFPLARKCVSARQNAFTLNGKIKLAVEGVSKIGRKKMVSTTQKISFYQQEQGYFSKTGYSGFHKQKKKSLDKRILFQLDTKQVSTSGNGEFV